ncbi:hypothetical protein AMECASPLE_030970, partial [Ameca splendens]
LQEDPPTGVSGAPSENNIMLWNAVIFGPVGTPFEDELHFSFNLIQPANVKFGVDNWKNGAEYKKHTVVYTQNTWKYVMHVLKFLHAVCESHTFFIRYLLKTKRLIATDWIFQIANSCSSLILECRIAAVFN